MTTALMLALSASMLAQARSQPRPGPIVETEPEARPLETSDAWTTSVRLNASHTLAFETDLDDSNASVTTNTTRAGVGVDFVRPDQRLAFGVALRGEISDYDFDNASTVLAGLSDDPFDTFTRQRLEFTGRYAFDRAWGLFGLVGIEAAYESGADFGDAIQGGGIFLGTWTSDRRDLTLGFGVGGFSQLDDDPSIFPIVSVRWQIDDQVRLETERLGLALTYEPCDEFDFSLFGGFERAQFRLDDNNSTASEGSLEDSRIMIGGRVTWEPEAIAGLSIALRGGAMVYREIELLDDDADTRFDDETDPSAFIGVSVVYQF